MRLEGWHRTDLGVGRGRGRERGVGGEGEGFEFLAQELPGTQSTFFFFFFLTSESGSLTEVFFPFFFSFFSLSFFSEGRKRAS